MSNGGEPTIVIEDLHASYRTVKAVDGVSLSIQRGECFGLLGPNGAGKTTLLSCLEGIKEFERGRILINGIDVGKQPTKVKDMLGVQLQYTALFPELTLVELVELYSSCYNVFPTRQAIIALLERFDLATRAKATAEQLSGGQKQRLTLALTIVHDPPVLLLDEPTAGLDPRARHQVWDLIRQVRDAGKTIILTTHYMEEAEVLCQRVAIIDHGRILTVASPHALIKSLGGYSTVSARIMLPERHINSLETHSWVHSVCYEAPNLTLKTDQPEQILVLLQSMSDHNGSMLQEIAIRRPNLEDVFLSMTGHALRETR